jgi:hypothetical protein
MSVVMGILAMVFRIVGYAPYLVLIARNRVHPSSVSFGIWTLTACVDAGFKIAYGSPMAAGPDLVAAVLSGTIAVMGLRNLKQQKIFKLDIVCFGGAVLSIIMWVVFHQAAGGAVISAIGDSLGYPSTMRKSWKNPFGESLWLWGWLSGAIVLTILALTSWNVMTLASACASTVGNFGVFIIIFIRQRRVTAKDVTFESISSPIDIY